MYASNFYLPAIKYLNLPLSCDHLTTTDLVNCYGLQCNDLLDEFHVHHDDVMSEDHLLLMCPGILSSLSQVSCRVASTDHTAHTAKHSDTTIKFYDIPAEGVYYLYNPKPLASTSLLSCLSILA